MNKVLWVATLSNGEVLYEEKGDYTTVSGALSPWNKLQEHLTESNSKITALGLYTEDGRRFNLPSTETNPKFNEFSKASIPVSYRMFRKVGADITGGTVGAQEKYTVVEATYEDGRRLQIWVDEKGITSWAIIV